MCKGIIVSNHSFLLCLLLIKYQNMIFSLKMIFNIMLPLYPRAILAFKLSYRTGLLFPSDYSLSSMIIVSDSSRNAPLLKKIVLLRSRNKWFWFWKQFRNFFDLEAHWLTSKLFNIHNSVGVFLMKPAFCSRLAQNKMLDSLKVVTSGMEWKTIRYNGNTV